MMGYVSLAIIIVTLLLMLILEKRKNRQFALTQEKLDPLPIFHEAMPYRKKKYFFTRRELAFYRVLKPIAYQYNLVIFPKARMADIVDVTTDYNYIGWFNRINRKHIDFVLCTAKTYSPTLLIELDDRSHDTEKRKARDTFVDAVMENAEIPILHIREYTTQSVEEAVKNTLQQARTASVHS